jgi:NAD(P)-dependent dehydrogenase (short-subunit alcohol dehydrogenase family)
VLVAEAPGGAAEWALGAAVSDACVALGARVARCWPISDRSDATGESELDAAVVEVAGESELDAAVAAAGESELDAAVVEVVGEAELDAAVAAVVGEAGRIDLLVVDGAALFAHALARGGDGRAALRACVDGSWNATRAVVNRAFLAAAVPGGRILYLAPAAGAGEYAGAACAGLENLGRTLSVEWARHGVSTVTIAPGGETRAGEVGALSAYLASPAGAYFSGCLLNLRGP